MAIRNVITRGYGAGATIAFVILRGYSISDVTVIDIEGTVEIERAPAGTVEILRTISGTAEILRSPSGTVEIE